MLNFDPSEVGTDNVSTQLGLIYYAVCNVCMCHLFSPATSAHREALLAPNEYTSLLQLRSKNIAFIP